ncbi:hypothetical protein CLOM_g11021 [Closterium sp. NIES-68]|nr:hypothetical protein CLOM_g11021 [Closterium sp. NIES-68]
MSFRPLIIGALLALFVSAAAAQTKSELIKEILGLRKALTQFKYLGRYTLVVTAMDKVIPKLDTFPEDGDLSIIGKKTILIPQNEALGRWGWARS